MKTAKEVCEDIRNQKVLAVIKLVEGYHGKYFMRDNFDFSFYELSGKLNSHEIDQFNSDPYVEIKLVELGYAVTRGTVETKKCTEGQREVIRKKYFNFLGLKIYRGFDIDIIPAKYESATLRTITISACCGDK